MHYGSFKSHKEENIHSQASLNPNLRTLPLFQFFFIDCLSCVQQENNYGMYEVK